MTPRSSDLLFAEVFDRGAESSVRRPLANDDRFKMRIAASRRVRLTLQDCLALIHPLTTLKGTQPAQQFPLCSRDFQIAYSVLSSRTVHCAMCYVKHPARLRNRGYNLRFPITGIAEPALPGERLLDIKARAIAVATT